MKIKTTFEVKININKFNFSVYKVETSKNKLCTLENRTKIINF
jgi:hypothetical protein